jgi:hypothetical protein
MYPVVTVIFGVCNLVSLGDWCEMAASLRVSQRTAVQSL